MHAFAPRHRPPAGRWLVALLFVAALRADPPDAPESPTGAVTAASRAMVERFIDRLPDLLDLGLPGFAPSGSFRLYTHPHVSDLVREDYLRVPVGARWQAGEHIELSGELGSYFTHGLGDASGYGLYEGRIGAKYERALPRNVGLGAGLDVITPLSRPPHGITDGMRHTVPYVSASRAFFGDRQIIGFTSLAADFISHTHLVPDFRDNELHSDSLRLTVGAARDWPRFRTIVAVSAGDTTLLSSESRQVYALRPSLIVPLLRRSDGSARAFVSFNGRLVRGPDGTDVGINTSVRIDLKYRPRHREP
jgi:hypothetical protein